MERGIIGLGKDCFVAMILRKLGFLRPKDTFDSLLTNDLGAFAAQIESNFDLFFTSLDNLDFYGTCRNNKRYFVQDKLSKIISVKHWFVGSDKQECLEKFRKDYKVDYFINRLKNSKSPLLLRTNSEETTLEEVMYLREVIEKVRGNDDFVLCIFQDAIWAEHTWDDIPSLKTFRVKGLFKPHAETYPDKPKRGMDNYDYFPHPRLHMWRPILNYIFDELKIDNRSPFEIKIL